MPMPLHHLCQPAGVIFLLNSPTGWVMSGDFGRRQPEARRNTNRRCQAAAMFGLSACTADETFPDRTDSFMLIRGRQAGPHLAYKIMLIFFST
jgi:hypothetical protein